MPRGDDVTVVGCACCGINAAEHVGLWLCEECQPRVLRRQRDRAVELLAEYAGCPKDQELPCVDAEHCPKIWSSAKAVECWRALISEPRGVTQEAKPDDQ